MEPSNAEARKRFEDKHEQNCNFQLVEELNRLKSQFQKRRDEELSPEESVEIFDKVFAEKTRNIKSRILSLTTENVESSCDDLRKELSETSSYLNQGVHFLNSYTILSCQQKLNSLTEEINQAQANLAPRKKFAFSKRTVAKPQQVQEVLQLKEFAVSFEGIQDMEDQEFRKFDSELFEYNCYQLKNLKNCVVYLMGRLKAVHMLGLERCKVFIGAVAGASHITNCSHCEIYVASHQIRIHQSLDTDFYVFVATNPIVESVARVRFSPFLLRYQGLEAHMKDCGLDGKNLWDQVQDFKWLKQEKSPNWGIIEEVDRKVIEV